MKYVKVQIINNETGVIFYENEVGGRCVVPSVPTPARAYWMLVNLVSTSKYKLFVIILK